MPIMHEKNDLKICNLKSLQTIIIIIIIEGNLCHLDTITVVEEFLWIFQKRWIWEIDGVSGPE